MLVVKKLMDKASLVVPKFWLYAKFTWMEALISVAIELKKKKFHLAFFCGDEESFKYHVVFILLSTTTIYYVHNPNL